MKRPEVQGLNMANSPKNPALFLLAMLKQAGGTARLGIGCLEVGPPELVKKLAPKIREHKASLVRLLLDQDCPKCGLEMASEWARGSETRGSDEKLILRRFCAPCTYSINRQLPDFPVLDKNGKEI